jgi:RNA polymerase sigma-70 factor (ECF subfamily)
VSDDGDEYTHDAPSDAPGLFEQLAMEQDSQCLKHCLEQLQAEPRQAILLAYLEGLTHAELAVSVQPSRLDDGTFFSCR